MKALDFQERLVPVAFLDVGVYVATISVLKNLILLGDLVKSTWFVAFQEDPFRLEMVAQDFGNVETKSTDFVAAEGKLGMVMCDGEGIMRLMEFDPTRKSCSKVKEPLINCTL